MERRPASMDIPGDFQSAVLEEIEFVEHIAPFNNDLKVEEIRALLRQIKSIISSFDPNLRIQRRALHLLLDAISAFIIDFFEDKNLEQLHHPRN
jgi:hypothetical protein